MLFNQIWITLFIGAFCMMILWTAAMGMIAAVKYFL